MDRQVTNWFQQMHLAATRIAGVTDGMTYDDYIAGWLIPSAVERQFCIIGELLNRIARIDEPSAMRLQGYPQIIAFRNVLSHDFGLIWHPTVWDVIQGHVPNLIAQTEAILAEDG